MRIRNLIAALSGLAFLALASSANATIVFAADEDTDFQAVGASAIISTTSGDFRSGYARLALEDNNGSGGDPPPAFWVSSQWSSAQSSFWFHAENIEGSSGTTANGEAFAFEDASSVRRIIVRGTGTSGQVKISKRNAAGSITDLVTCANPFWPQGAALGKIDAFVVDSASGTITLYYNGVQFCTYSGDTTTDGVTSLGAVELSNPTATSTRWSEIVIATTDTRSMNLFTCYPNANGTNQTWTGSYTNINPTAINDASQINTATSGNIAEFACPALPGGTFNIPAISETARLTVGASGPQTFYDIVRPATGSTDYNNGSPNAATTSYQNYNLIWALNPATSAVWTPADLASGFNFGVESQP